MTTPSLRYRRFFDAFAEHGEFNMPVDRALLDSAEFPGLLERLKVRPPYIIIIGPHALHCIALTD